MWYCVGRVLLLQVIREAASIDEGAKADGATVHVGRSYGRNGGDSCLLSVFQSTRKAGETYVKKAE